MLRLLVVQLVLATGLGCGGTTINAGGNGSDGGFDGHAGERDVGGGEVGGDDTGGDDVDEEETGGSDGGGADTGGIDACGGSSPADATAAPIETFDYIVDCVAQYPISCPSSYWQYKGTGSGLGPDVYLQNTGSVPLVYSFGCLVGNYPPGVPRGGTSSTTGVLMPFAAVHLNKGYVCSGAGFADLGSSKPFSMPSDGGFPPADEGTIPWPDGVSGSEGSKTMYVAQLEMGTSCGPATPSW